MWHRPAEIRLVQAVHVAFLYEHRVDGVGVRQMLHEVGHPVELVRGQCLTKPILRRLRRAFLRFLALTGFPVP